MSNAIGSSRESNPSRRICHLRAVPLGHVADKPKYTYRYVFLKYFMKNGTNRSHYVKTKVCFLITFIQILFLSDEILRVRYIYIVTKLA